MTVYAHEFSLTFALNAFRIRSTTSIDCSLLITHRDLKVTKEYKERREVRDLLALRESLDSQEKLVVLDHREDKESLVTMENL